MHRITATSLLVTTALVLGGCQKFEAREHFHRANNYYKDEDYQAALHDYKLGLSKDPTAKQVWRSLGFAALALYRPGDDSPQNKGYADTAVDAFRNYLAAYPGDQKVREYLESILAGSGRNAEAIQMLQEDADQHPGDMKYQMGVISAMAEAGQLDAALQRAQATHASDPQVYHAIGVTAWSKSYRSPPPDVEQHRHLIDLGIQSLEKALQMQGDKPSVETLTYINLLWREKVKTEPDPFKQQDYIKTADEYRNRALELRRQQKGLPSTAPSQGQAAPQGQQGG
jgi:tetratricopeptide (TPR) repeat protein